MSFEFPCNFLRAFTVVVAVDRFPVRPDTDRYDMEVNAGYVFVFEEEEGLGAVPHTFHVFVRYFDEPRIRQPVFRVGIERSVEYGIG